MLRSLRVGVWALWLLGLIVGVLAQTFTCFRIDLVRVGKSKCVLLYMCNNKKSYIQRRDGTIVTKLATPTSKQLQYRHVCCSSPYH